MVATVPTGADAASIDMVKLAGGANGAAAHRYHYWSGDVTDAWAAFAVPVPDHAVRSGPQGPVVLAHVVVAPLAGKRTFLEDAPHDAIGVLVCYAHGADGRFGEAWGHIEPALPSRYVPLNLSAGGLGTPPVLRFHVGASPSADEDVTFGVVVRFGDPKLEADADYRTALAALGEDAKGKRLRPVAKGDGVAISAYSEAPLAQPRTRGASVTEHALAHADGVGGALRTLTVSAHHEAHGTARVIGGFGVIAGVAAGEWAWRYTDAARDVSGNATFAEAATRGRPPVFGVLLEAPGGAVELAGTFAFAAEAAAEVFFALATIGIDVERVFGAPPTTAEPLLGPTLPPVGVLLTA